MDLRIVLVEDNEPFLRVARTSLERHGDVVVGAAATGDEAVERVTGLRPDVILVDVHLGGESGLDVVRRLSEVGEGDATVILMSSHSRSELADLVDASPAAGFLQKLDLTPEAVRRVHELRVRARSG
jgi:CheY-like chemotaxis protein